MKRSPPKIKSATARPVSVLPVPDGPTIRKTASGRLGSCNFPAAMRRRLPISAHGVVLPDDALPDAILESRASPGPVSLTMLPAGNAGPVAEHLGDDFGGRPGAGPAAGGLPTIVGEVFRCGVEVGADFVRRGRLWRGVACSFAIGRHGRRTRRYFMSATGGGPRHLLVWYRLQGGESRPVAGGAGFATFGSLRHLCRPASSSRRGGLMTSCAKDSFFLVPRRSRARRAPVRRCPSRSCLRARRVRSASVRVAGLGIAFDRLDRHVKLNDPSANVLQRPRRRVQADRHAGAGRVQQRHRLPRQLRAPTDTDSTSRRRRRTASSRICTPCGAAFKLVLRAAQHVGADFGTDGSSSLTRPKRCAKGGSFLNVLLVFGECGCRDCPQLAASQRRFQQIRSIIPRSAAANQAYEPRR